MTDFIRKIEEEDYVRVFGEEYYRTSQTCLKYVREAFRKKIEMEIKGISKDVFEYKQVLAEINFYNQKIFLPVEEDLNKYLGGDKGGGVEISVVEVGNEGESVEFIQPTKEEKEGAKKFEQNFKKEDLVEISKMDLNALLSKETIGKIEPPLKGMFAFEVLLPVPFGFKKIKLSKEIQQKSEIIRNDGLFEVKKSEYLITAPILRKNQFLPVPSGYEVVSFHDEEGMMLANPSSKSPLGVSLLDVIVGSELIYKIRKIKNEIVVEAGLYKPSKNEIAYWRTQLNIPKKMDEFLKENPNLAPAVVAYFIKQNYVYICNDALGQFIRANSSELNLITQILRVGHCDILSRITAAYLRAFGVAAVVTHNLVSSERGDEFRARVGHSRVAFINEKNQIVYLDITDFCDKLDNYVVNQDQVEVLQKYFRQAKSLEEKKRVLEQFRQKFLVKKMQVEDNRDKDSVNMIDVFDDAVLKVISDLNIGGRGNLVDVVDEKIENWINFDENFTWDNFIEVLDYLFFELRIYFLDLFTYINFYKGLDYKERYVMQRYFKFLKVFACPYIDYNIFSEGNKSRFQFITSANYSPSFYRKISAELKSDIEEGYGFDVGMLLKNKLDSFEYFDGFSNWFKKNFKKIKGQLLNGELILSEKFLLGEQRFFEIMFAKSLFDEEIKNKLGKKFELNDEDFKVYMKRILEADSLFNDALYVENSVNLLKNIEIKVENWKKFLSRNDRENLLQYSLAKKIFCYDGIEIYKIASNFEKYLSNLPLRVELRAVEEKSQFDYELEEFDSSKHSFESIAWGISAGVAKIIAKAHPRMEAVKTLSVYFDLRHLPMVLNWGTMTAILRGLHAFARKNAVRVKFNTSNSKQVLILDKNTPVFNYEMLAFVIANRYGFNKITELKEKNNLLYISYGDVAVQAARLYFKGKGVLAKSMKEVGLQVVYPMVRNSFVVEGVEEL